MKLGFACLFLSVLVMSATASAQVQTGSITGTVFDPNGNSVPGAKVSVRDLQSGTEHKATTTPGGEFTVPGLPFGTYSVSIEAPGFRKWETKTVHVVTSQEAILKATLELGSVNEVITVEEAQAVINTVSAELTTHIDRKQILDLPVADRNPLALVSLQAGVTGGVGTRTSVFNGLRGNTNNITQDGINVQDNFIRNDGFFAQTSPTVENTGEFSISSQNIGSDSGRGVGQVRISTPRGTNDLHGSLFYFHRNDAFAANSWFNNLSGLPKDKLRQHRFGGNVGGPIEIPKLYHGRERTFFFFRYEGFRENLSEARTRTVLTQSARTGQFSYVDANGQSRTVNLLTAGRALPINPFTKSLIDATPLPNTSGGDTLNTGGFRFLATGSDPDDRYTIRVDHKLIDQEHGFGTHWLEVDANWGNFTITPDFSNNNDASFPPGVAVSCTGGVCLGAGQSPRRRQLSTALNSTFGSSLFNEFRFGYFRPFSAFTREAPFPRSFRVTFQGITNPEQNFLNQGRFTPNYSFTDNLTKTWRAHTFKAGFQYVSTSSHPFNDGGTIPTVTLNSNTGGPNSDGLSASSLPGLPGGSAGNAILNRARAIYQDLTGLLGSIAQTFNAADPVAGFIPGATSSEYYREHAYNLYFSDSWRMKPRFTLNYGVRYELIPAVDVVNKRAVQPVNGMQDLFFSGPLFTVNPSVTFGDILTGRVAPTQLVAAGTSNGKPLWNTDKDNFAPFIGIAWQAMEKTVIRTGFSVSYTRDGLNVVSNAVTGNSGLQITSTNSSPTGTLDPSQSFARPTPPLSLPISQLSNFITNAAGAIFTFDPNLRTPYVLQWSFGIQRELWPSTSFEVRYVGNHAAKLYRGVDFNQINLTPTLLTEFNNARANLVCSGASASFASAGPCNAPLTTLTAMGVPASFFTNSGLISNVQNGQAGEFWFAIQNTCAQNFFSSNGVTCPGMRNLPANLFLANPLATGDDVIGNGSHSVYHGLQVEMLRQLRHGLQLQGNYTFAKVLTDSSGSSTEFDAFLDLHNPRYDRTRATFDIRHTFNFNGIWELPVGRGRRWVSSGILGKMLEGWQTGAIWSWRSGRPVPIVSGFGTVNRNVRSTTKSAAIPLGMSAADVCSQVGVHKTSNGAFWLPEEFFVRGSGFGTNGADFTKFANPGAGQLGTQGLVLGCSGPGVFNIDMNMVKRTHITERVNFEFRAEFFNIFNHPNFLSPLNQNVGGLNVNNINNPGFGTLNNPNFVFSPREIQFNFRLNF